MRACGVRTLAIQTPGLRAYHARSFHLAAKSFPRQVHAHSGILRGDAGPMREVVQSAFLQIHDPQRIPIFGLERLEKCRNATADLAAEFCVRARAPGKLPPQGFPGARRTGRFVSS